MTKKTYMTPALKAIDITAAELLAGSETGNINTGGGSGNDNYETIPGYDENDGGWPTGSPD